MDAVEQLSGKPGSEEEKSIPRDENIKESSGDVHQVFEKQIIPTRSPSAVEQDISPSTQTQED